MHVIDLIVNDSSNYYVSFFNDLVIFNQNSILPSKIDSKLAFIFFIFLFNTHISKIQSITHNPCNCNIKCTEFFFLIKGLMNLLKYYSTYQLYLIAIYNIIYKANIYVLLCVNKLCKGNVKC